MAESPSSTQARFEAVYQESWVPVFRLALAWTNDWAAAEDLAQEAFIRLWDRRDRVNWNDPMLPWLLVVVRRLATDRFRRLRTIALRTPRSRDFDEAGIVRWLDVRSAFAQLTSVERSALVLVSVIGLTYEEAAGVLGTTAGALRGAASRGRDKLERLA
ncbi:MAG: sigma-70 family RNA polymerase sigma factor [Chloroflexi bacterium]|nr:sigma-70 family RNA polymerase sigma factor [Chloroflexota bacterium]